MNYENDDFLKAISQLSRKIDDVNCFNYSYEYQIPYIYFEKTKTFKRLKPILKQEFPHVEWEYRVNGIIPVHKPESFEFYPLGFLIVIFLIFSLELLYMDSGHSTF